MSGTLVLVILAAASAASDEFDPEGWQWKAPFVPSVKEPGFVRLVLPPQLLDVARADLADLRLVDGEGRLTPYVLHQGEALARRFTTWQPVQLLNRTFRPGEFARITADFGQKTPKNRLKIILSGSNFRRRVTVEACDDGVNWETLLPEAWLFDSGSGSKAFRLDLVDVPLNDFRYVRVTAFNMPDDPDAISIEQIQAEQIESVVSEELVPAPIAERHSQQDLEKKQSVITLDLKFRHLPVRRMVFTLDDPHFYRAYEVLGRDAAVEKVKRRTETGWDLVEREVPWQSVVSGALYRVQDGERMHEHLTVDAIHAPYRYLQVRIRNGDDAPLSVAGISVFQIEKAITFGYDPASTYSVYAGNDEVAAPRFDLARALPGVGEKAPAGGVIGPLDPLDRGPDTSLRERYYAVALGALLVAAVGVTVLLIVRNLRRLPRDGG